MNLLKQAYRLLDSILVGEYGLLTRCSGVMLMLSKDFPDGTAWTNQLSADEVEEIAQLLRSEPNPPWLTDRPDAFLAAGVEPRGHRVVAWGIRKGEQLIPEGWSVWLGGERLPVSLATRAANFAQHIIEEMMRQGAIKPVRAPLHFGWQEEALDSLQFCAMSALNEGIPFPEAEVRRLLEAALERRGFGFVLREEHLIWLVVEATPEGFRVVSLSQQPGSAGLGFGVIAQA
ncbi:hypothetical protein Mesil_3583 (plasmid) [Allomeiothermus silvanus DSM 9946]|uniref:Uncharacterized protein n=1 Tax=Allomeiothermus silvanus (strain ATCC 700542 / DSM 9946 / NBRC 106475 / NCIMB 13440 / VI-R2) TaxID=526227 RepID=D7BJL7_ALLS1|nr:hypothetical protein [Allomeiothermus silvanus]ADH65373.1 hypothetical protein Mesil_3583 [Allomeiothermus silvanus DSM 9946]